MTELLDTGATPLYSLWAAPCWPHLKSAERECWSHLTACHQLPAAGSWEPCPWPGRLLGCLPDSAVEWSDLGWSGPALSPAGGKWALGQNLPPWPCSPSCTVGTSPWASAPGSDLEESLRMGPHAPGTKSSDRGCSPFSSDLTLPWVDAEAPPETSVSEETPPRLVGHRRTGGRARLPGPQRQAAAHHHWLREGAPGRLQCGGRCSFDRCSDRRREPRKGTHHLSKPEPGSRSLERSVSLTGLCGGPTTAAEKCTTPPTRSCCPNNPSARGNCDKRVERVWRSPAWGQQLLSAAHKSSEEGGDPAPTSHRRSCSTICLHKAWLQQRTQHTETIYCLLLMVILLFKYLFIHFLCAWHAVLISFVIMEILKCMLVFNAEEDAAISINVFIHSLLIFICRKTYKAWASATYHRMYSLS